MKTFTKKFLIFISPIVILSGLNFLFLKDLGELKNFTELSIRNQQDGALIGLSYSEEVKQFKFKNIQSREPEILTLGTSRVLQVRDLYFKTPHSFYNAGRLVTKLNDITSFLENYPGNFPKIIILGLDQNFFSYQWDSLADKGFVNFTPKNDLPQRTLTCSRKFIPDILKNKVDWSLYGNTDSSKIGLTALTHNEGFRADGSYLYGRHILSKDDKYGYSFNDTKKRIKKQRSRFKHSHINPKALIEFENILTFCAESNIHLITFLPPYSNEIYNELNQQAEQYPYIFKLQETLSPLCKKYGSSIYDFSDLADLGANDFETIDGFHGSETAYLKMIKILSTNEPKLAEKINIQKINHLIHNPYSARQLIYELKEAQPQTIHKGH